MKKLFIILLLSSCSTKKPDVFGDLVSSTDNTKRNEIGIDMWSLDSRMRARLLRYEKYNDFSGFDSLTYLQKAKKHKLGAEAEYIEFLESEDLEVLVIGHKMSFTVCTQSKKQRLTFCDKADTQVLEFSDNNGRHDLNKKIKEYL